MDFRAGNTPRPTDVFIALMGVTGSGKSSFIKLLAGDKKPKVGHGQTSCTGVVDVYPCRWSDGTNVYLIDTPGFNDTDKSDTEILLELATWLGGAYSEQDIQLHGIIYLHRILEPRMQGSMRANLRLLEKLVGSKNLKNVILTTTNWDVIQPKALGIQREKELKETPEFWGEMRRRGSTTHRHDNTKESAYKLITRFVRDHRRAVLSIQDQMVNRRMRLSETHAGRSLVDEERAKFEKKLRKAEMSLKKLSREKDEKIRKVLEEREKKHRKELDEVRKEHQRLNAGIEALWRARLAKMKPPPPPMNKGPADAGKNNAQPAKPKPKVAVPKFDLSKFIRSKPENHIHKPGFRASICMPYYSLDGPNKNHRSLPHDLKKGHKITLGSNKSWVSFNPRNKDEEILASANFPIEYPGLSAQISREYMRKVGALQEVVLGPDANFLARFENKYTWSSSNVGFSHCFTHRDDQLDLVAFGIDNSFLIRWRDGTIQYDIPNHRYPGLDRKLFSDSKRYGAIKLLALDPNGKSYICITEKACSYKASNTDDRKRFGIEEFCTLNAGTTWSSESRKLPGGELVPVWLQGG